MAERRSSPADGHMTKLRSSLSDGHMTKQRCLLLLIRVHECSIYKFAAFWEFPLS